MNRILNDLPGAVQYIVDAQNEHPNRIDVCEQNTLPDNQRGFFAVGRQQIQTPSAFGQPSASGQPSSFGQPSAIGAAGQPRTAFGAPSFPGAGGAPTSFGQPSAMGAGRPGAFGQPSAVGGFGQPSQLGGNRPSPFPQQGGPTTGASPFGQQQPNPTTGASPSSQQGAGAGAGSSPFAQLGSTNTGGGFGQPSQVGANPSPFAQQNPTPTGVFGRPSGAPANPFGNNNNQNVGGQGGFPTVSDMSMASPVTSSFTQPAAAPSNNSGSFGAPSAPSNLNPFARASQPAQPAQSAVNGVQGFQQQRPQTSNGPPRGLASQPAPSADISSYATHSPTGQLLTFKRMQVIYDKENKPFVRSGNKEERVWFPNGPPPPTNDIQPPPEAYGPKIKEFEEAYRIVKETGSFKDGLMPEEAPQVDWVRYDL